jgi:hypothetical protein
MDDGRSSAEERTCARRIKNSAVQMIALQSARSIAGWSGKPRVDEAGVRAVWEANFPRPSAAMSTQQRTFVLPYQFR